MELDAVDRLRHRSLEMQRTIEGLVEARDHARGEAAIFRRGEEAAANASRDAQERGDPTVRTLRQQLLGERQKMAAAPSPQSMREHAEGTRDAQQQEEDPAGDIPPPTILCCTGKAGGSGQPGATRGRETAD